MSPWGSGPEPAEHEFMRRLFRRWDSDMTDSLSLQNVVTGFAAVKGTKDIMSNISYFFELYDDDGDGKVDREGILRISEALLFLSRRGVIDSSPSNSTTDIGSNSPERLTRDEQFLSSVSAFIRRCFEYADPDHSSKNGGQGVEEMQDPDNFAIGDDDEEEDDLIDFGSEPSTPKASKAPVKPDNNPMSPAASTHTNDSESAERNQKAESANLALDPNKPLHITLPTFRMVILADEVLEQFFEVGFSSSFRLAEDSLSFRSSSSNLTTFSNAGKQNASAHSGMGVVGGAGVGIVPPRVSEACSTTSSQMACESQQKFGVDTMRHRRSWTKKPDMAGKTTTKRKTRSMQRTQTCSKERKLQAWTQRRVTPHPIYCRLVARVVRSRRQGIGRAVMPAEGCWSLSGSAQILCDRRIAASGVLSLRYQLGHIKSRHDLLQ
jgi:hypothetical protein